MEREYLKAKEICREALREWRCAINDHLPDEDGTYLIDWDMDEARYVQRETNECIDVILSTCMYAHCAYELGIVKRNFENAIKANNIAKCKESMKEAHWEFYKILRAVKAIKEA